MRRWTRAALTITLLIGLAGCASKQSVTDLRTDHDALKVQFGTLKTELQAWSVDVVNWETLTYHVLCDVVAKNPKTYEPQTVQYCPATAGTDGAGKPPDPPDFE